jgi:hypothetical protein
MGGKRWGRCIIAAAMINLIHEAYLEEYATVQHIGVFTEQNDRSGQSDRLNLIVLG